MKYIAKLSGGRDSTAMVFRLIEEGYPLDYIIFSDTGKEFGEMYDYLDRVKKRLGELGYSVITLNHVKGHTFEDWVFGKLKRGKLKGHIRGLPNTIQKCYWQRESKSNPVDRWIKENLDEEYTLYIGYTYSEKKRASKNTATNQRYPLIELKMCEADIDRYLESIDLVNPLYQFFERTGCAMCPYQKQRGYFVLWKKFPEWWEWMKEIEHKLMALEDSGRGVVNSQWNIRYTLDEFEDAFKRGVMLHEVEAPKACECGM